MRKYGLNATRQGSTSGSRTIAQNQRSQQGFQHGRTDLGTTATISAVVTPGGVTFTDGTVLELLAHPSDPSRPHLLVWKNGKMEVSERARLHGKVYVPTTLDPSLARAVRFPTRVAAEEKPRSLFRDTTELLRRYLNQGQSFTNALVFHVFASWTFDVLPAAPPLFIAVPVGSAKPLLLRLLGALCRRPLRLAGTRHADFRSLPLWLRPTLLLDEPDARPSMLKLLQTTIHRGSYVSFGGQLLDLSGAKIICARDLPREPLLGSQAITVSMIPAVGQTHDLSEELENEIVDEFQARFLGYRLRNLPGVQLPDLEVSSLTPPAQYLAKILAATIVGESEIQNKILPIIAEQDEECRSDRSRSAEATLIEALLFFDRDEQRSEVRAAEIADRTNAIWYGRGESQQISAESVGWALKRLGLHTQRLGSAGNGLKLTEATRRLVHRLAIAYDVRAYQLQENTELNGSEPRENRKNGTV